MIRVPKQIDTGLKDPQAVAVELLRAALPLFEMKEQTILDVETRKHLNMAMHSWRQLFAQLLPHVSYVSSTEGNLAKLERLGRIAAKIKAMPGTTNAVADSAASLHGHTRAAWQGYARQWRVVEPPGTTARREMISQMVDYHVSAYCHTCKEAIFDQLHVPELVNLIGRDAAWGTFRIVCAKDRTHPVTLTGSYGKNSGGKHQGRVRGELFKPVNDQI